MSGPLNLNIDVASVDTSMPRLAPGPVAAVIDKAEVLENKQQTGHNLLVIFKTTEPVESTQGGVINPGYQLRKYYPLQQSANENAPDFKRDLAVLYKAAFGDNPPALTEESILQLIGQQVELVTKVTTDPEYGEQNEIRSIKRIG